MHAAGTRPAGRSVAWHAEPADEVLARLGSGPGGLTTAEAARRLADHGPNTLTRRAGPSAWRVLGRQFTSPLIYALLASVVVAAALGDLPDAGVVLGVVVLNALIGFAQEYRAGRTIRALARLVAEPATVRRDGRWVLAGAELLVPGDVVAVEAGARVAADLRILRAQGLRADEAALTGESVPVDKTSEPVDAGAETARRHSLLHGGTLVSAGSGEAVVVATGDRTEIGRIAGLVQDVEPAQTPMTRSIARFGSTVTAVIAVVAAVLLAVALLRGYPLVDAALAAITLAVAAVPEGLPAIVTIALAVGVQRMARRRAVVRELPAVETLGSTSVVCADKTGTLTRNEMAVRRVWLPDGGELALPATGPADPALRELLTAGVVANEARAGVRGDPTDLAFLTAAASAGPDLRAVVARRPPGAVLPFDHGRRYVAGVLGGVTYLKGAPEVLLDHVGPAVAADARPVLDRFAADGLRVLALARRPGTSVADPPAGDLVLLGLVGLIDPPRPGAAAAVAACREAGVTVKMITGDHPATAAAVGRELGITGPAPPMTGAEIAGLPEAELRERVRGTDVFARVEPEHKLRLVRALQAGGAVTAMTGDGVNDAPALRQADVGVAMGRSGTAAAKEAADIVLGDDDVATIRAAVEEGRRVYDNLVKALAFALPTNVGEGLIVLVAVLAFPVVGGRPVLPVEPVQILWINLVATVTLALPLALEACEPDLMRRPPRDPRERLLSRLVAARTGYVGALMAAVAVAVYLLDAASAGAGSPHAQTLAVTAVAFFQIFYLFTCRTLTAPVRSIGLTTNPAVFGGVALLLALQACFVHLPPLRSLFHTAPLTAGEWLLAAVSGAVVVPVVAVEKAWRRRRGSAAGV